MGSSALIGADIGRMSGRFSSRLGRGRVVPASSIVDDSRHLRSSRGPIMDRDDSSGSLPRRFPTTNWSRIAEACDLGAPGTREALESLCRAYWYPLYLFIRRRGYA